MSAAVLGLGAGACGSSSRPASVSATTITRPSLRATTGPPGTVATRSHDADGSPAAGPPSTGAVAGGRYVRPVVVNGLRVSPAAPSTMLGLTWTAARARLEATSALAGSHLSAVLGYGAVTVTGVRLPAGVPAMTRRLAWVGIVWGGVTNCPTQQAPPAGAPPGAAPAPTVAPAYEPIYTAVVMYRDGGQGVVVYTGRGTPPCGGALRGPTIAKADEVVSEPWQQRGAVGGRTVALAYLSPSCAMAYSTGASGHANTDQVTVTVEVQVPFDRSGCRRRTPERTTVQLSAFKLTAGVGSAPRPTVHHGPTGPVAVLQVRYVAGDSAA